MSICVRLWQGEWKKNGEDEWHFHPDVDDFGLRAFPPWQIYYIQTAKNLFDCKRFVVRGNPHTNGFLTKCKHHLRYWKRRFHLCLIFHLDLKALYTRTGSKIFSERDFRKKWIWIRIRNEDLQKIFLKIHIF